MSANDYVQIVENNVGKFEVSDGDMDTDWHSIIGITPTLKKAILMAKRYMKKRISEGCPVEYGMEIYFKEEREVKK